MTYKLKSLFTLTCLSVALLGTGVGISTKVSANESKNIPTGIVEIGYEDNVGDEYPLRNPYLAGYYKGKNKGFKDGLKLFNFNNSSELEHYPKEPNIYSQEQEKADYKVGYNDGYITGYADGKRESKKNYPFLSLIGDTWNWGESWFR